MRKIHHYCFALILLCCSSFALASDNVSIKVTGVSDDAAKNVSNRLESGIKSLGKSPSKQAIDSYLNNAKYDIRKAIEPFGYFRAIINTHVHYLRKQHEMTVKIIPGPVLKITQLTVKVLGVGREDADFIHLLDKFPLKKGAPLLIKQYNDSKKAFFHIAEKRGFLDAKFKTNKITVDLDNYTASVVLIFKTGPHYYFGPVTFAPSPFATSFLRRFIHFKHGQAYSTNDLLVLQDHLNSSNYFQQVQVQPEFKKIKGKHVPIMVDLVPKKAHRFTVGVGYDGSKDTIRGTLGWDWRRVTSTGHRLQALAQGSLIQSTFQLIYTIPGRNPLTDRTSIQAAMFHQDLEDIQSNAIQFGVAHISNWREWQRTLGITGLIERQYDGTNQPTLTTNWLYPTFNVRRIHADNTLNTNNGYMLNFLIQGAVEGLLSDHTFVQAKVDAKYIKTFNHEQTRAILRGSFGITAVDSVYNLAPSLRYYTGGSQTVRGFRYKSLGPGKYVAIGSAEIQHVIIGEWRAAAFTDFGNAFNNFKDPILGSFGVGIVRRSPVGSINIGVAKQFGKGRDDIAFIFSMGPDLA